MILVLGVTASGKGSLAFELARILDGEIVSIDSMKVYRRMDIGTAKPAAEKRRQIPYHLIDVVEPSESFSVDRRIPCGQSSIVRGKPVVANGADLCIKTLCSAFDGPVRPSPSVSVIGSAEGGQILRTTPQRRSRSAARSTPTTSRRRRLEVHELTGRPSAHSSSSSPPAECSAT
jgi:tRNA dimethylallyltransferase